MLSGKPTEGHDNLSRCEFLFDLHYATFYRQKNRAGNQWNHLQLRCPRFPGDNT